jgi:phage regulator Rha-like protein
MMGIEHYKILRKLEGGKDRKGYIEILTDSQMGVSDYFIKSSYKDESGKENPCYLFTKMGCEFIANKFTGEKGILFTAKYVKRFNEMEGYITNSKALNCFKAELTTLIDGMVSQKIDAIEEKCSHYYRPTSFEKQNISQYIKKRLGIDKADEEYELVKQRVLIKLNATKWEDIPVEVLRDSLNVIDESIRVIKADRVTDQISLFDIACTK